MRSYATIKRGKVKLKIGGAQDKFLHFRGLKHSHIHFVNVDGKIKKKIIRYV